MATLTLVDEGTLRVLPPDNMTLRLFTNDLYLTHFSIASDFTFDATHDKTLTQGNWTAANNTTYIGMTHTSQSYSFTSSATYYGFAYVLSSGYVYFAAKFDTPWTVFNGTTKYITPYIQISNYNVVPANNTSQGMEPGSLVLSGATPGQLKVEDDAVHLVQGVVLGNLVMSGGTLGDSKVLGTVPTSLIQGVTIGDITIVGSSLGNVKTVAVGAATIQGITGGAITFNGLSTDNKYTAAASGTTYTFESGDDGFTFSHSGGSIDLARSTTNPITGSYSLRAAATVAEQVSHVATRNSTQVNNGQTISVKYRFSLIQDADANGSVAMSCSFNGNTLSLSNADIIDGSVHTASVTWTGSSVSGTLILTIGVTPETWEGDWDATDYIVTIDDVSIS